MKTYMNQFREKNGLSGKTNNNQRFLLTL
jgi:hypothetical protein